MLFTRVRFFQLLIAILILGGCAKSYTPYTAIKPHKPIEYAYSVEGAEVLPEGVILVKYARYAKYEQYYYSPTQSVEKPTGEYEIHLRDYVTTEVNTNWKVYGLALGEMNVATTDGKVSLDGLLTKGSKNQIRLVCLNCSSSDTYGEYKINNQVVLKQSEGELYSKIITAKKEEKSRFAAMQAAAMQEQKQAILNKEKALREGDGSPDDLKCKSFGFKFGSKDYGECRIKLEAIASQNIQQQRADELKKQQFDAQLAEQKRAIDAQVDAQKRQRQLQASQALLNYSQTLSNPAPSAPANQTYIMPSGKAMNCTTTGTVTNCF